LRTLCTNRRAEIRTILFPFYRFRTLAKTTGGVLKLFPIWNKSAFPPLAACFLGQRSPQEFSESPHTSRVEQRFRKLDSEMQ
jgi:hypothetical protein